MANNQSPPILVTHSGKFHCDEVFAYAALRAALGLEEAGSDHVLLRTRKPELIESGTIVWDVGTVYDPDTNRFDHHQRGAPLRGDGTPYSSAGLIWKAYGVRAVAALLAPSGSERFAQAIAAEVDASLVRRIDEIDNGVSPTGPVTRDSLGLASLVGDFNPSWDDAASMGPTAGDEAFMQAAALVMGVLKRRVESLRARHMAESEVLDAHRTAEDPRLLILGRGMPVVFAVTPASNGNWMLDTMPPEPGSFAQRLPLPASWAGLQADELAAESGVPDAVFVHLRRFVGAARSRDGAVDMARKALATA
jgi:uncharacterized UPF0160 family protein